MRKKHPIMGIIGPRAQVSALGDLSVGVLKGLILDFGGVFTRVRRRTWVLHRVEASLGLPRDTLIELLFTGEHWFAVSTGRASVDEYWKEICATLDGRVPVELQPFKENPFAYEELNLRMVALAKRLHKRYRIALLSNATPLLDRLLCDLNLNDLFDTVVNSSRVGLRKPDAAIYLLTLERLGLPAGECLFVDDKQRNTDVALALGMRAVTFRSASQLERELRTPRPAA
jgi:putative hydrolase of the HAD superfamily